MTKLRLNDLINDSIPEEEKHRCINELFQASFDPTPEQLEEQKRQIDEEIKTYELRHGVTSDKIKDYLRRGKIRETAEICSWLMLLKIRERFEQTV